MSTCVLSLGITFPLTSYPSLQPSQRATSFLHPTLELADIPPSPRGLERTKLGVTDTLNTVEGPSATEGDIKILHTRLRKNSSHLFFFKSTCLIINPTYLRAHHFIQIENHCHIAERLPFGVFTLC